MPRKSTSKTSKKPTMRKAKRMVSKQRKTKAKKNMDTFFLQAKYTGTIAPVQGTTVSNYLFWNPSLFDPTDMTYIGNNSEFKLYQAQYDKVRINSIRVVITPKANVLDQAIGQADAQYNVTGDGMVHTCVDRDGKVPASIAKIQRYPSYRKYSVMKKFTRTYSVKYGIGQWLDCQDLQNSATKLSTMGLSGSICLYAENLLEDNYELLNEPWADYEIFFNCVFQGKTSASLSFDASGNIIITPEKLNPTRPAETTTLLRGSATGDVRFDASGNLVPVTDSDLP